MSDFSILLPNYWSIELGDRCFRQHLEEITHENIIKLLDSVRSRESMAFLPPVNLMMVLGSLPRRLSRCSRLEHRYRGRTRLYGLPWIILRPISPSIVARISMNFLGRLRMRQATSKSKFGQRDRVLIIRRGHVPEQIVADWIYQILLPLRFLHNETNPWYTIHRDLKPENIFVDFNGLIKLADFGQAKTSSGGQRHTVAIGVCTVVPLAFKPN